MGQRAVVDTGDKSAGAKAVDGHSSSPEGLEQRYVTDQTPLAEIVRRYGAMVYSHCLRLTKNAHDAEDATQAVFMTLATQRANGAKIHAMGPWLQQVARRASLDMRRSGRRRLAREGRVAAMKQAEETAVDPLAATNNEELGTLLRQELDALPAKFRMPMVLHYYGGMSRQEMAQELRVKVSTLGVRLFRGRQMLAKRLAARGVVLSGGVLALALGRAIKIAVGDSLVRETAQAAAEFMRGASHANGVSAAQIARWSQAGHFALGSSARWKLSMIALALAGTTLTTAGAIAYEVSPAQLMPVIEGGLKRLLEPVIRPMLKSFFSPTAVADNSAAEPLLGEQPGVPSGDPVAWTPGRWIGDLRTLLPEPAPAATPAPGPIATEVIPSETKSSPRVFAMGPSWQGGAVPPSRVSPAADLAYSDTAGGDSIAPSKPFRSGAGSVAPTAAGRRITSDAGAEPASAPRSPSNSYTRPAGNVGFRRRESAPGPALVVHRPIDDRASGTTPQFPTGNPPPVINPPRTGNGGGTGTPQPPLQDLALAQAIADARPRSGAPAPLLASSDTSVPAPPPAASYAAGTSSSSAQNRYVVQGGDNGWSVVLPDKSGGASQPPGNAVELPTSDSSDVPPPVALKSLDGAAPTWQLDGRVLAGYGKPAVTGSLDQSGQVIADGAGAERTLDLSAASQVRNSHENPASLGINGWFATRKGKLALRAAPAANDPSTLTWGEDPNDPTIDLVNSVRVKTRCADSLTPAAGLSLALLAADRTDVPAGLDPTEVVGLWSISNSGQHDALASLDVAIRYDDTTLAWRGGQEQHVQLWAFESGAWSMVQGASVDLDDHVISGLTQQPSYLAVVVPEPSAALALAGIGSGLAFRRRRRP